MVIAINTLFFSKENDLDFFKKVIYSVIASHPEHTFLLISHEENTPDKYPNIIMENTGIAPAGINRWSIWIYFRIRNILKKYKPDVLINNGEALLYFKDVPQIVFNPELKYIQDPSALLNAPGRVFKLFAQRYYQKANSFIVVSDFEKNFLKKKFGVNENIIHTLKYGADKDLKPIEMEERETIKEKYAKGFEYFLYTGYIGSSKNLVILLKAFSAFKKRQKSSMQLLLAGRQGALFNDFKKLIELYKYKNDVHIIDGLTAGENESIISSAYAMIFPDQFDKSVNTFFTALKYQVPSIVTKTGSLSETGGNAVLHFESESVPDLAGKLMLIFKDEKFRKNLIENSRILVNQNNFQNCIEETWKNIETTGEKSHEDR